MVPPLVSIQYGPVKRWVSPHGESPWREGGYPLFAMSFNLPVITAAAYGRTEPQGYVLPRPVIYSRN